MGGKDELGVQTDLVEEFSLKDMKVFPGDFRLPESLSGFSAAVIKKNVFVICGGNTGNEISNRMYFLSTKNDPVSWHKMPPMKTAREEFALLSGPN